MHKLMFSLIVLLSFVRLYSQDSESEGETPSYSTDQGPRLIQAARRQDQEGMRQALRKNADVNYQEPDSGMSALHYCAINGDNAGIRLLLGWGADINSTSHSGYTPLHYAVEYNRYETVRLISGWGAAIDIPEEFMGRTPLYMASAQGYLDIMRNLLYYNADVNKKAYYRMYSPLHAALENHHFEAAELLLQKGSFLNPWSVRNFTPLHWAVMRGDMEVLEWLITKGATLEAVSTEGYSALHLGVLFNQAEAVTYLLSKDIDTGLKTTRAAYGLPEKITALDIARIKKNKKIEAILLRGGAR